MKRYILGLISGILLTATTVNVFSSNNLQLDIMEASNSPIIINSKPWQYTSCYLIDDKTYVPLREFCEETGIYLKWQEAISVQRGDEFYEQPSQIQLRIPYVRDNEVITLNHMDESDGRSFLNDEIKQDITTKKYSFEDYPVKTPEIAAKIAGLFFERIDNKHLYGQKPYMVNYEKSIDAWAVKTNLNYYRPDNPQTGGSGLVVISRTGDVLYCSIYR
ncbi:hypothetical protein [Acetivibrio sp. MSJd-27]|uniref:hypothetical protein n=1 Tax=Acetivibrio sp. MSJd-27 TaxID=2841523 RepID=UPI001C0FA348|nr:hypothetical protein [Acetivibrio sp. MSJd-27]MBU5451528.1 hypothetical protein [Acetivibrio sp. MSJd-27]